MSRVLIYDSTLRDGTQREGISLSADDKLRIAVKLDEFGVDYIEGGWPGSNPKDSEFFRKARDLKLVNARLVAFGSTRRPNTVAPDATLQAIDEADTPVVALFGKSWQLHVLEVLRTTLEENLRMIGDSVAFFKGRGREVVYDAEHFFDGYLDDADYALATLRAATEAGADSLVLCDTNGGRMPSEVAEITRRVVAEFGDKVGCIGIHAHNDSEVAVANTLVAVEAGALHVQGAMNGYGERAGNANLCSIIPNLVLKMGHEICAAANVAQLTELSRFVAEVANLAHDSHLPYVGASAFAHKAGMHVNAVLKTAASFEHVKPESVGNRQRILISELGGRSNILHRVQQFGLDLTSSADDVRRLIDDVKRLENEGFQFEAAEASFELLVRRTQVGYQAPFEVLDMLVLVEQRRGVELLSEATVKVKVGDEVFHTASDGYGPVNALDRAMRKALVQFYPALAEIELVDYKVRVLNEADGTESLVRVSIETSDGRQSWNTMGSSVNIIEASWLALVDSYEFALLAASGQGGQETTNGKAVVSAH